MSVLALVPDAGVPHVHCCLLEMQYTVHHGAVARGGALLAACRYILPLPFSQFPRALFDLGYQLAAPYNALYDAVSRDRDFLLAILAPYVYACLFPRDFATSCRVPAPP